MQAPWRVGRSMCRDAAIRVKRAVGSYAKDIPHNGQLGEIVLKDSEQ